MLRPGSTHLREVLRWVLTPEEGGAATGVQEAGCAVAAGEHSRT